MKEINNIHKLFPKNSFSLLPSRFVFLATETGSGRPDTPPNPDTKPPIKNIDAINRETPFTSNLDTDLKQLANNDNLFQANLRNAIEETLNKQNYGKDIKQFWKDLKDNKCSKILMENGLVKFLNKESKEITPKLREFPIEISLKQLATGAPRSRYYDPTSGLVDLKGAKETKEIRVQNIILNERIGTLIKVTDLRGKTRTAAFKKDKNAYYLNGNKERAKIFNGYHVKLVNSPTQPSQKTPEINHQYPSAGGYRRTLEFPIKSYLATALNLPYKWKKPNLKENEELNRLRALHYTSIDQYAKFLKKNGGIKSNSNNISLLIDTHLEKKRKTAQTTDDWSRQAQERKREKRKKQSEERLIHNIPVNALELRKFKMSPSIIALIDDPAEWSKAWVAGTLKNLRVLKGIIESEPIFGIYSKNPDLLRQVIVKAIAKGDNTQIDFEDFLDSIVHIRLPSYSQKITPREHLKGISKFSNFWKKLKNPTGSDKLVQGFLKKLGINTYNSATLALREPKKDKIEVNLIFEGHAYRIVLDDGWATNTVSIFTYPSLQPYPNNNGYDQYEHFTDSHLTNVNNSPNNKIIKWFRNAVTPRATYSDFVAEYKKYFDKNGTPKYKNIDPTFLKRFNNIIIAGNRFLSELQELKYCPQPKPRSFFETRFKKQRKLISIINKIFPLTPSNRAWADVHAGIGKPTKGRLSQYMAPQFANGEFIKEVVENGKINETKMLKKLNNFIDLAVSRGPLTHPGTFTKEYNKYFNGPVPTLTVNSLAYLLNNPEIINLIHDGFLDSHNDKIKESHEKTKEQLKELYNSWKNHLTPKDYNTLKKALIKAKIPKEQIPKVIQKVLPLYFGAAIDFNTGNVTLGAGVLIPVKLGNYGTIYFGGGAGIGLGITTGVDVGAMIGYKTPHLGPFSLVVGGGAEVNIGTKGVDIGVGYGVGIPITLTGRTSGTKITITLGVAMIGGVIPFPCFTISCAPNQQIRLAEAQKAAEKGFGLDKIITALRKAKSLVEKKTIIGKNPWLHNAISSANKKPFAEISAQTVITGYKTFKHNLDNQIISNYDPGNSHSFGIGMNNSGKFILGVGSGVNFKIINLTATIPGKTPAALNQQITVAQRLSLLQKLQKGTATPQDKLTIRDLRNSGKIIHTRNGDEVLQSPKNSVPSHIENGKITNIPELEKTLNKILGPLHLKVQYDRKIRMFELEIMNRNENTNYDIAIDPQCRNTGLIFHNGKIYIGSDFNPKSNLTILRSDYTYPFKKQGAFYHSIITISDSPLTSAINIYKNAPKLLSARGDGVWRYENGFSFDSQEKPPTSGIYSYNKNMRKSWHVDEETLADQNQSNAPTNSQKFNDNFKKLTINESEKGNIDHKSANTFSKYFIHKYPIKYRRLSTAEINSRNYFKLNGLIIKEWKNSHKNKKPSIGELNYIRTQLLDNSFSEGHNFKNLQKALSAHLRGTEQIVKTRFENLIKQNHQKYHNDDPRYIIRNADQLGRIALNRMKDINANHPNPQKIVELNKIDRSSTVVATLGILGFRASIYSGDALKKEKMIGASNDYSKTLRDNPNSAKADLARLILEENSPLPNNGIIPTSNTETLNNEKENISELLGSDLSLKIMNLFQNPLSQKIFNPGVRDEIIRLAANRRNLTFNTLSAKAIFEFKNLLEGLRKAEDRGDKYYTLNHDPDFIIKITLNIQDGVYVKCANYSNWINEGFDLQYRTSKMPATSPLRAAYGQATASTVAHNQVEYSTIGVAAALAITPPAPTTKSSSGGGGQPKPKPGTGQTPTADQHPPATPPSTPTKQGT